MDAGAADAEDERDAECGDGAFHGAAEIGRELAVRIEEAADAAGEFAGGAVGGT